MEGQRKNDCDCRRAKTKMGEERSLARLLVGLHLAKAGTCFLAKPCLVVVAPQGINQPRDRNVAGS